MYLEHTQSSPYSLLAKGNEFLPNSSNQMIYFNVFIMQKGRIQLICIEWHKKDSKFLFSMIFSLNKVLTIFLCVCVAYRLHTWRQMYMGEDLRVMLGIVPLRFSAWFNEAGFLNQTQMPWCD